MMSRKKIGLGLIALIAISVGIMLSLNQSISSVTTTPEDYTQDTQGNSTVIVVTSRVKLEFSGWQTVENPHNSPRYLLYQKYSISVSWIKIKAAKENGIYNVTIRMLWSNGTETEQMIKETWYPYEGAYSGYIDNPNDERVIIEPYAFLDSNATISDCGVKP